MCVCVCVCVVCVCVCVFVPVKKLKDRDPVMDIEDLVIAGTKQRLVHTLYHCVE